jgi:hypothetical protein
MDSFETALSRTLAKELRVRIDKLTRDLRGVTTMEQHRGIVGEITAYESALELLSRTESAMMGR